MTLLCINNFIKLRMNDDFIIIHVWMMILLCIDNFY